MIRRAAPAAALALVLGACGGSTTTTRTQTATTPTATTPTVATPDQQGTSKPEIPRSGKTSPETQPGGAGDEQAARVPVRFTLVAGRLRPPLITVPATFRLAIAVRNADVRPHVVGIPGRAPRSVASGATVRVSHRGLPNGRGLVVAVDGRPAARIASGLQPGP